MSKERLFLKHSLFVYRIECCHRLLLTKIKPKLVPLTHLSACALKLMHFSNFLWQARIRLLDLCVFALYPESFLDTPSICFDTSGYTFLRTHFNHSECITMSNCIICCKDGHSKSLKTTLHA